MALHRGIDDSGPLRPEPVGRLAGVEERRRRTRSAHLAGGTLACPCCDAPVAPGRATVAPADPLACPFCGHAAAVRDFLSLTTPARPARVEVRVVAHPLRAR